MVMWMGLAMTVPTRLWLAGVVSQTRDRHLADRLLSQVRTCALAVRALLVATRQMPTLPKQHQTSVSREDQGNSRERKGMFTGLAGFVYCHGDQAHREAMSR